MADHYHLEAHQLYLLRAAAEAWDDYTKARTQIEAEGRTVPGREGIDRPHPLTNVARDCRAQFARIVEQLNLETGEPDKPVGRPPLKAWPNMGER